MLFQFVSVSVCFRFCLCLFLCLPLGITCGNPISFFVSREAPPTAEGGGAPIQQRFPSFKSFQESHNFNEDCTDRSFTRGSTLYEWREAPFMAARSAAHRRRRWGPWGREALGRPTIHLPAGTRMFYALDSNSTDVLWTARANQGRRKQPAGLRNVQKWYHYGTKTTFGLLAGLQKSSQNRCQNAFKISFMLDSLFEP